MRRFILFFHLYVAAFAAPVFIMLAISGGLYLIDIKGEVTRKVLELPAGTTLDFESDDLKADVTALLANQGISHRFEHVTKGRSGIQTRPSSRITYQFQLEDGNLKATRITPDIPKVMIELHKGHGPRLFRLYQKLVAIALLFTVLSGVWVGFSSRALRNKTALTSAAGLITFVLLGFVL